MLIRDAFSLDPADPLVAAFQRCYESISGTPLPLGPKPFVDDGNSFVALGGIAAITHGPRAGGQHTVNGMGRDRRPRPRRPALRGDRRRILLA